MSPLEAIRYPFHPSARRGRVYFSIVNAGNWIFLAALPVTLKLMTETGADTGSVVLYFSNWTLAAFFAVLSPFAVAQRCRDIGWSAWLVILSFVPVVNFVLAAVLMAMPGRPAGPEEYLDGGEGGGRRGAGAAPLLS